MKQKKKLLQELIDAVKNSDIEYSKKEEIIKKLESGEIDKSQAIHLVMDAIGVACAVWNCFPH